ncbi:MAG: hypothetical protein WDO74_25715 [Pseudomonadota bacterium]
MLRALGIEHVPARIASGRRSAGCDTQVFEMPAATGVPPELTHVAIAVAK